MRICREYSGTLGLGLRKVYLSLFLAASAALAQNGTGTLTIVSGASYQPTIAPDSLATVFGTGLSTGSASGQLGPDGQFPTSLGGTTVTLNGEFARLLYISPTQINFLVPRDTASGIALVVVSPSISSSLTGSVKVSLAAPALFSADGTGKGTGSILNAVTFTPEPFSVMTGQNSGSDKSTRLAIFGTGIRYAGNLNLDPTLSNVAKNIMVQVVDSAGTNWPLTVEYAGAAPIYPGLDQINAVLPKGLDGAGLVAVTVSGGASLSNSVTLVIASSIPPSISALSVLSAPPGTQVQVAGIGFALNTGTQVRSRVLIELPDGTSVFMPVLNVAPTQIVTLLVPILQGTESAWYSGPAKLCIQVDGQLACSSDNIQIMPRLISSQPPGQVTLTSLQSLQNNGSLAFPGNTALNTFVQQQNQINLSHLADLISQAASGTPPLLELTRPDGSVVNVPFNLDFLRTVDSLLLANVASTVPHSSRAQPTQGALSASAGQSCGLTPEDDLQLIASQYQAVLTLQDSLAWFFMGGLVTEAVVACIAGGPICLASASAAVTASLPTADAAYTAASWGLFATQIGVEGSNAFLNSISARFSSGGNITTLEVLGSDTVATKGNFGPKYPTAVYSEILAMALSEILGREFASYCGPIGTPTRDACEWLFGEIADKYRKLTINFPTPPTIPQGPSQVDLSSSSVTATPTSTPEVSLSLPCLGLGQVVANAPTSAGGDTFGLAANRGNLLIYGVSPSATLTVIVNQPAMIQSLTISPTTVTGGASLTGTVTLSRAAGKNGLPIQLASNNPHAQLPTPSFIIPPGQPQQTFSINTLSVSVIESATVVATSGTQSVSAGFTINPSPSRLGLSLSSSTVTGGQLVSGTVSLTPFQNAPTIVLLASNNSAVQVPASVQIAAGGSPASFTVTTSTVTSIQTVTITASYQGMTASTTLEVDPTNSSVFGGISLDKSAITGGDTVFGTVILSTPAPAGGATVLLRSSDASVALVQAAVTVPFGQGSARFSVSTYAVTSTQTVTITGTSAGVSKNVSLTLNPKGTLTLSDFTLSPPTVNGGNAVTGTLIFSDLTPSGGAVVTIQSGDPSAVQVPSQVHIPGSTDFWQITITTSPVMDYETVPITATFGGASRTANLLITPFVEGAPPVRTKKNPTRKVKAGLR